MVQFYMLQLYCFLTSQLFPGVSQGVPFTLIPSGMGSCHGQILIEMETYSFHPSKAAYLIKSNYRKYKSCLQLITCTLKKFFETPSRTQSY